jgi:catechol 2,3-dioxygenase-like lactoylglutathione lyase family enzyme
MIDHVTICVSDRAASRAFYTTVLGEPDHVGGDVDEWKDFSLTQAAAEHLVTRHLHVGFASPSPADVDAFWRRGVEAGYSSDGEPGLRTQYTPDYYGAFVLDPDGNSVEAVHRPGRTESGSPIDHLWLGVADLAASRRFWEAVAPVLGLSVADARFPGHVVVARDHRHLMLVADGRPATQGLDLSFPAHGEGVVNELARVANAWGYGNGAQIRDPDGNTISAVNVDQ